MSLQPTFSGYIANTHDALLLFQACISGLLPQVSRRPHDRERGDLIRSGTVFIFNEQSSGIKRWTDGIAWSPSRILGNFLVYRQLEKPFAPGEKKRTAKRGRKRHSFSGTHPYAAPGSISDDDENGAAIMRHSSTMIDPSTGLPSSYQQLTGTSLDMKEEEIDLRHTYEPRTYSQVDMSNHSGTHHNSSMSSSMSTSSTGSASSGSHNIERSLVGSLVDSYGFKEDGLIKKTMSILVNGQQHHLVSYYRPEDVMRGDFSTPSSVPGLRDIIISEELVQRQNFRIRPDQLENESSFQSEYSIRRPITSEEGSLVVGVMRPDNGVQVDINNYEMDIGAPLSGIDNTRGQQGYYQRNLLQQKAIALSHKPSSQLGPGGNGGGVPNTSHPSSNYISDYRPFGSAGLPVPQSQTAPPSHPAVQYNQSSGTANNTNMNNTQESYHYSPLPPPSPFQYLPHSSGYSANGGVVGGNFVPMGGSGTNNANNRSGSTTATAVHSPSLPPLSQSQGYSYQSYPHDYNNMSNLSDPRKLPDTVKHSSPSQPHQLIQQQNQPQPSSYGYTNYGYSQMGQW